MRNDPIELTPELRAEGWLLITPDCLLWMHHPVRKAVSVTGPIRRAEALDVPLVFEETINEAEAVGFVLCEAHHNEHGIPTECVAAWISSSGPIRKPRFVQRALGIRSRHLFRHFSPSPCARRACAMTTPIVGFRDGASVTIPRMGPITSRRESYE